MAKPANASKKSRADDAPHWDGTEWNSEPDEAACQRARALLNSGGGRGWGDRFAFGPMLRSPWLKWTAAILGSLGFIFALCFAALWLRLGAGPINLDMATPWLAEAIEQNIGQGNTVEVGGTQIERAGRIRIAVRIRDVIVRDRDRAIVASAPKAEVRLSGTALLMGQLRAESINLVDAELAIRIKPDGTVTVSTGNNEKPLATGVTTPRAAGASSPSESPGGSRSATAPQSSAPAAEINPILAGLEWIDSLSLTGLDGQNLNEIGLKNGLLVVDDQQRGTRFSFENVSLSLRRPSGGGIFLSLGEEGDTPWSLRVLMGAPSDGVRSVDIRASKVSTAKLLLALRLKDLTYGADLPLTGELKGEIGRDGVPTVFRGRLISGAGTITDSDTPDYPMHIDQAEFNIEWDAARRVLLVPFKVVAGPNRLTLLAHFGMVNDSAAPAWDLGFSGGTIVLPGEENEQPLIFNKIAVRFRIDPRNQRIALSELNINNGEIGVNGSGAIDYSGEPMLNMTFVGTPMSASALKRVWPVLIVPEVREWVLERVARGTLQRMDIGIRSPVRNLSRKGPPIPDDGLLVNIVANNVAMRPVDDLPMLRDGELRARVTGRTATVAINGANMETATGRKIAVNDIVFEVPDMAPKPSPARVKFKVDGQVPAVAEILSSDRLAEFTGNMLDPATSKGNVSAQVSLGLPIKRELTKADTTYAVNADLSGFSAEKLMMNQKIEAGTLKVAANNQGYQVRGDIKIGGQQASLDYRKPTDGDADVKLQATLDDASRARLGFDLGTAASGAVPVKLSGKIANAGDMKFGMECDLTALKLDNLLPGWTKLAGRQARATFNMIQKPQSTRFEDIVVDGGGASIKGSVEIDQNGDLLNATFPVYSPSEGDKTSLKAERGPDGAFKITMRGDVFDGRGFIKSAMSGRDADTKSKTKNLDFDLDLKLGAVAGFYGEAVRGVDVKLARRSGAIRSLSLAGKLGRDTPLTGELRGKPQGREVIYVETNDAGAFLRFTDTYAKVVGGQLALAMEPPVSDSRPREGLINVRDFAVKGEGSLDKFAASGQAGANGVTFSRMRAEFTRQNGQLQVREGVVKGPTLGATIEGNIDFPANQVRMSGTFVPMYGLNNMFGQIPIVGLFLGGGSNEGLFGVTYEVVGSPGQPVMRVNPVSAMAPGVLRKIFEFNTGRQNNMPDFPNPNN